LVRVYSFEQTLIEISHCNSKQERSFFKSPYSKPSVMRENKLRYTNDTGFKGAKYGKEKQYIGVRLMTLSNTD